MCKYSTAGKIQTLLLLLLLFVFNPAKSQDPFSDLEKKAKKTNLQTLKLGKKVLVDEKYPGYQINKKKPIQFVPFELKDKNGNPIDPNSEITLKNGRKVKAIDQLNELNKLEQALNAKGHTLRDNIPVIAKLDPNKKFFTFKKQQILGPPLSEERLKALLKPQLKTGNLTLRPLKYYSKSERQNLSNYKFSVLPNGKSIVAQKTIPRTFPRVVNNRLMQEINRNWGNCWKFGDPDIFGVAVCGNIDLKAKVYSYDVNNPRTNPSSYLLTSWGSIDGGIFGSTYNALRADGKIEVKSDYSQQSKIDLHLKIAGSNIFDFEQEFPSFYEYENHDLVYHIPTFEKDGDFEFLYIFTVGYKASVNGQVGVYFGATLDKTLISGYARPFGNLDITGEASVGVDVGFASLEVGARGNCKVIDGHVDLYGSAGLWSATNDQLVIFANLNSSYDLTLLKGKLELFGEACFLAWCEDGSITICDYPGIRLSGEIFRWNQLYTVGNDSH